LNNIYYIDRCELWGFIREINSGIYHHTYSFAKVVPAGKNWYFTCCVVLRWIHPGEYTYDCKLKKLMLLTTLAHNQHDVIDVIW